MKVLFAVLAATVTVASGLVRSYFVEPKSASLSGWTGTAPGHDYVSEVVTCSWDEMDSASTGYVELFQGDTGTGSLYKLDIYEYPSGVTPVASNAGVHAARPQSWVKMLLTMAAGKSFTKGKLYEFRFTRSLPTDSIQFYWQVNDPYPYQNCQILVGGQPYQSLADLAMRVYGRLNPIGSSYWGAYTHIDTPFSNSAAWRNTWQSRVQEVGLGWGKVDLDWARIESVQGTFDFSWSDTIVSRLQLAGCEPVGMLLTTAGWASTRIDSVRNHDQDTFWCTRVAPRGLWNDPDSNHWAKFCSTLVGHYSNIHT